MSPDVISVVIPAYREGRFLDDCLSSVQAQTYSDLEIIVVDDAGLDESIGVALRHARQDSRIHVLRLRENHGLGASRNVGLASASGSLVTFLDADDLLPPDSIQLRQNRFDELRRDGAGEPRVAAVYGDWRHIEELAVGPPLTGPSRPLEAVDLTSTDGGNPFIVAAPLVDREALLDSGGFAEGVPCCEDYLAWMRLLDTGAVFEPVREVVAFYRQKRGSMLRETAQPMLAITAAVHDWHRLQVSQGRPDEGPHHLGWGPDYHEQANGQKMEPKNLTSSTVPDRITSVGDRPTPLVELGHVVPRTDSGHYRRAAEFLENGGKPVAPAVTLWPTPPDGGSGDESEERLLFIATTPVEVLDALAIATAVSGNGFAPAISTSGSAVEALGLIATWPIGIELFELATAVNSGLAHIFVAFRDWGPERETVASLKLADRSSLILQTSGASAFDWTSLLAATRYQGAPLLVRNRIEQIILGDRGPRIGASGAAILQRESSRTSGDGVNIIADLACAKRGPESIWLEQAFQAAAEAGADCRIVTPWASVAASLRDYDVNLVSVLELFEAGLSIARLEDEGFWLADAGCDVVFVDGRPRKAWIEPFIGLGVRLADPAEGISHLAEIVGSTLLASGFGWESPLRGTADGSGLIGVIESIIDGKRIR
jgi:hypothetical protein